jgi:hypothetical protein
MIETLRTAIAAADTKGSAAVGAAVDQVVEGVSSSVVAVNAILLLNLLGATDRDFDSARAYYWEQGSIIAASADDPASR